MPNGSRDNDTSDRVSGLSRRTLLAGLGGSALAGIGVTSGQSSNALAETGDLTLHDAEDLEEFVDALMADRIGDQTPGAVVAVVEGDDPVLTKGYGTISVDSETPVRAEETLFRIGSVAKTITFTGVMQGVERGLLDLDEDVNTYLEDSRVTIPDTFEEPVTLRHLGTHTAGFGVSNLTAGFVDDSEALTSVESALVDHRPERKRPPGEAVAYSNYGSLLAGHILAEAQGTAFEEYVQSEIFQPLGMDHSTFVQPVPDDHPGQLATPHAVEAGAIRVSDPVYTDWWPAGSMTTTAADMATFMRAHLGDGSVDGTQLFEQDTTQEMHAEHYGRHPAVNGWAYGFWEDGRPEDNTLAHSGGSIHFISHLVLALEHDVGFFVSYNARGGKTDVPALEGLTMEFIDEYGLGFDDSSADPTSGTEARRRADRVAGEYGWTWEMETGIGEFVIRLAQATIESVEEGELTFDMIGMDEQRFVETEPYVYHERGGHDVLAFDVEDENVIRAHRSSDAQFSWEPVPFSERQLVAGGTVGIALIGFLFSTLGWGGVGAWRWWQARNEDNVSEVDGPSEKEGISDEGERREEK